MTPLAKKVAELFGKPEVFEKADTEKKPPGSPPPAKSEKSMYQELADATPSADALLVFPDWQGLLVKSKVLGMSVWVVRNHLDGIALARETGHPALLLDDVIRLKGRTAEEARTALLPALISVEQ